MSPTVFACRWALVLPALLASAVPAADAEEKGKVRVCVVVILATENDKKVDKQLEHIAREVRKMQPKLTGFHFQNVSCKSLPIGSKDTFELLDDQAADVTVQRGADKDDKIRLKVRPPLMGEITYSTACGKFLPIVTPYRNKSNDLLIIAVRVQPCRGK
jgi:hypothetical protein